MGSGGARRPGGARGPGGADTSMGVWGVAGGVPSEAVGCASGANAGPIYTEDKG